MLLSLRGAAFSLKGMAFCLSLGLIPSVGACWSESNAEELFKNARAYTVKIRTSVLIPFSGDQKGTFMGAGFVIDKNRGWIATNAHVVSRSRASLQVASTKFEYEPANTVYIDPIFDIAIIESKSAKHLEEAKLDCKMNFSVGVPVGAFGHPWDTDCTGTKGIISTITSDTGLFGEFVQTDAPINHGNSGGPLINLKTGKIIGMNTAGQEKAQNMNYAVTSEQLCNVVDLLKEGKDPTPPRLGLMFFKNSDNKNTLRIAKITSPTNNFGFQVGDIITGIQNGKRELKTEPQLLNALRKYSSSVSLSVLRKGKTIWLKGKFEQVPAAINRTGLFFSGILIKENDDPELQELMSSKNRLVVSYVESGSLGENKSIASADLIELVDGKSINNLEALEAALLKAVKENRALVFRIKRPSFDQGHVFSYLERDIAVKGVERIQVGHSIVDGATPVTIATEKSIFGR